MQHFPLVATFSTQLLVLDTALALEHDGKEKGKTEGETEGKSELDKIEDKSILAKISRQNTVKRV